MIDLINKRFTKLKVIGISDVKKFNRFSWNCLCDCGNKKIATTDELRSGRLKSCGCLAVGKGRYNWKGNKVGSGVLHKWVRKHLPNDGICKLCGKTKKLELANIENKPNKKTYNRNLKNWRWVCHKCHITEDGRLQKIMEKSNYKGHIPWNKNKRRHFIGVHGAVGFETQKGLICAECKKPIKEVPAKNKTEKQKNWKERFEEEFGIHLSESELQFCLEFIEELLAKAKDEERKRILKELPEEKIRWRKSDSENFEAGEENGYINGFNECLLEIEELLK